MEYFLTDATPGPCNVMLDLETWGTAPGSALRSIGAVMFDPHERREERHRDSQQHEHRRRGPSPRVSLVERDEERDEARGKQDRPDHVEPLARLGAVIRGDDPPCQHDRDRAHRDVDVEHRTPPDRTRQPAT